jgi:chromosome segregation ATPase
LNQQIQKLEERESELTRLVDSVANAKESAEERFGHLKSQYDAAISSLKQCQRENAELKHVAAQVQELSVQLQHQKREIELKDQNLTQLTETNGHLQKALDEKTNKIKISHS